MNNDIERAIWHLKQAMSELDKAEEKAFKSRSHAIDDEIEKITIEVAKLADDLVIVERMAKVKEGER